MAPAPLEARITTWRGGDARSEVAKLGAGEAVRLWRRGPRALLSIGAAATFTASGPLRLPTVKRQAYEVLVKLPVKRGVGVPEALQPLIQGGFSFSDRDGTGCWASWPAAEFVLPRRQILWTPEGSYETVVTGDAVSLHDATGPPPVVLPPTAPPVDRPAVATPASWATSIQKALDTIAMGRLQKVVVARQTETEAPAAVANNPLQALTAALWDKPGNVYLIHRLDGAAAGTFAGVSPETLVRLGGVRVESHAVAASSAPGGPLGSEKDKREHDVVVDFIRDTLQELGVNLDRKEETRKLPAGPVTHLETPVSGRAARGLHILDVAHKLHPTPAIAGHPKEAAVRSLGRLEGFDRGWYAGAVGWFDGLGQGEFTVALRGALVRAGQAHLFAGAGIVAGSKAEAEWSETEAKLATMRQVLSGAEATA